MTDTKWCAWDIEVATRFPDDGNWQPLLPLGITCAAISTSDGTATQFTSQTIDPETGKRADTMSWIEIVDMLLTLMTYQMVGYPVITWNGLGFDFRVLCDELRDPHDHLTRPYVRACQLLARHHVDLGWLMRCRMGYMIGLDTAAAALQVKGKTKGMVGSLAPLLWSGIGEPTEEEHENLKDLGVLPGTREAQDLCLQYVQQDAAATSNVMGAIVATSSFHWTTRAGKTSRRSWKPDRMPDGKLMTVWQAMSQIPEPDTSWQENPRPREGYHGWTSDKSLWSPTDAKKDDEVATGSPRGSESS